MKNQGKILLLLSFALIAFGYFIWQVYSTNNRLQQTRQLVNRTYQVIQNINDLLSTIIASESATRAYAITHDPDMKQEVLRLSAQVRERLTGADRIVRDSIAKNYLSGLRALVDQKLDFQVAIANSPEAAVREVASLRGKRLMDSIRTTIRFILLREQDLLKTRNQQNEDVSQKALLTTIIGSIIFFVFIAAILWALSTDIQKRIRAERELQQFRHRFQAILDNTPLLIFLKDLQGRYILVNKSFRETVRASEEQIIGKTDFDFEEQAEAENYKQSDEQVIQTLKPVEQEEVQLTPTGRRFLHYTKFPVLDQEGKIFAISGFGSDVTARKEAEEKLRSSEAKMRALLDTTKEGFYLLDQHFNILLLNESGKEMMRLVSGKIADVGENMLNVILPERLEEFTSMMNEVLKGKTFEFEQNFTTAKGQIWLLINYLPVRYRDSQAMGICVVARDITELVRYREQLIEAKKKAERAEKLQEQFLANMSHEIRTPLNGIIGMTNLLLHTQLTADQFEYANIIKYSSDNLSVLINDILDFSKIKAGKLSIENIEFNLWEVAQKAVAALQPKAREKDLGVLIFFHTDTPSRIKGDPHRLNQVLSNLLGNAIKFTQQGYVRLEIAVASETDTTCRLQFQVKDSGIGIPEDKLAFIFESFSQAGEEITRKYGGTGLGLTITKQLIELQNGCIDITSKPGAGTTISLEIPYEKAPYTPSEEITEEEESAFLNAALFNKKILVVEDNEVNQKVITYNLEPAGVITTIAVNGREAVNKLEAGERFDLIIMDLQMPVMNGFQATAYIRQKLRLNTPIIAMTASALRNEQVKCFELGMNEYVTKPFAPTELFRLLEKHINGGNGSKKHTPEKAQEEKPYNLDNISIKKKKDVIAHVLNLFLQETPPMLLQVKDHILHENWDETYQKAHKLKSSVGLLQMNDLLQTITIIEQNAKNREQLDSLPALIDKAIEEYHLIQPMLEAERDAAQH
ncbi:MAG TPA: PAS domain-containing protein [Chitinophagaceae bacterium]|nr:PAS domain-containing protein [Chitinophagaceae bacterium]